MILHQKLFKIGSFSTEFFETLQRRPASADRTERRQGQAVEVNVA